jgi:hypothetical protein
MVNLNATGPRWNCGTSADDALARAPQLNSTVWLFYKIANPALTTYGTPPAPDSFLVQRNWFFASGTIAGVVALTATLINFRPR